MRQIKYFAGLIYIVLASLPTTVHADFNKAVEAYVARDAVTMLAEVREAVAQNNNDGLLLFLDAMSGDASAGGSFDSKTGESMTTLREILSKTQWNELRSLLTQASDNSTVDVQYNLRRFSQFQLDFYREVLNQSSGNTASARATMTNDKKLTNAEYSEAAQKIEQTYILRGSKYAMFGSNDIFVRAEAGNSLSQLQLGLKYLNAKSELGCGLTPQDSICKTKDEAKGYAWLKRAVKSYEISANGDIDELSYEMCQVLRENANGNQETLRQAYLWALMGMDFTAYKSRSCLYGMHDAGELKRIAPALDIELGRSFYDRKTNQVILLDKELPEWVVDARNEVALLDLPVFSVFPFRRISVFEDGRITSINQDQIFMRVSPDTIKAFLAELKSMGFYEWSLRKHALGLPFNFCFDNFDPCRITSLLVTARNVKEVKRFNFGTQGLDPKSTVVQRMAQLILLVDKYFPNIRREFSCSFAKSESHKQACEKDPLDEWRKVLEAK